VASLQRLHDAQLLRRPDPREHLRPRRRRRQGLVVQGGALAAVGGAVVRGADPHGARDCEPGDLVVADDHQQSKPCLTAARDRVCHLVARRLVLPDQAEQGRARQRRELRATHDLPPGNDATASTRRAPRGQRFGVSTQTCARVVLEEHAATSHPLAGTQRQRCLGGALRGGAPRGDERAGEHHRRPVKEGRVVVHRWCAFRYRRALSRQGGLGDQQRGVLDDASVGSDGVAGADDEDVVGEDVLGRRRPLLPAAPHPGGAPGELSGRRQRPLGAAVRSRRSARRRRRAPRRRCARRSIAP